MRFLHRRTLQTLKSENFLTDMPQKAGMFGEHRSGREDRELVIRDHRAKEPLVWALFDPTH